jgi:hypothetical protein
LAPVSRRFDDAGFVGGSFGLNTAAAGASCDERFGFWSLAKK